LNPGKSTGGQINEVCGTCHRKPPEFGEETDWTNAWNTRHEPDYLSHSTCFRKSAGVMSCLTCHNPHQPLASAAADYDKRCGGCHRAVTHRTAVARQSCTGCHMPQTPAGRNLRFTNHWIGIYEAGNKLVPRRRAVSGLLPLRLAVPTGPKVPAPADPAGLRPLFEQAFAAHENDARAAGDLGLFLKSVGEVAAAESPLRKAMDIDQANADAKLPADEENLAGVLATLGRAEEAVKLFQSAAAGSDAAVAARSYAALAALDPARAEAYYRSGLEAEEKASGKDHVRVAVFLNNLALAVRARGDNAAAEPLLRRALAIQEKALGPDHAAAASTLNNLGSLLQSTGKLDEAERVERRALRIFEQKLGPESVELAITCANVADLAWTKGDRAGAETLYRRALSIDESVYGPDHVEVAGDLTNLGMLLKESGKAAAADAVLGRALAIYEKEQGPESESAQRIRKSLVKP
jgi:tetratricopeptide (TPR) repeat protein